MTTDAAIVTAIKTGITLAALGVVWFWLARRHCIELFRQQMFGLRDRLFDEARGGIIAFDHPAYVVLRGTINGFVRFGERLGALQLLLIGATTLCDPVLRRDDAFERQWQEGLHQLPRAVRLRMEGYRREMVRLTLCHILRMSPIFTVLVVVPVGLLGAGLVLICVARARARRTWARVVGGIESTALAYGGH